MILYISILVWLILTPSGQALHGVTESCCSLALNSNATMHDTQDSLENRVCGQKYSPELQPAADFRVNLTWCDENCKGYRLYEPIQTTDWAVPLVSFILPAVIFSSQIPRRRGLQPLPRPREKWKQWGLALPYLILDSLIIILDTTIWVFAIMIGSGPFILSGLVEMWLDYRVTKSATNGHDLSRQEQIDILTAVIAGNLLIKDTSEYPQDDRGPSNLARKDGYALSNPQEELKEVLSRNANVHEAVNSLLSMLESQMSFGAAVGAAIALYVGSFVYTLSTIGSTEGDGVTARALAFGIWWMIIVHVSVVGGSLLAGNNPSTAAAIAKRRTKVLSIDEQFAVAQQHSQLEDRVQSYIEVALRIPLTYDSRYEPSWMWNRGKNKALWLQNTSAWQEKKWFRETVGIPWEGWAVLIILSYLLVFVPCALAFWMEYRSPPVALGCRSMTILLYMVTQTIFILASAFSHIKSFREDRWSRSCRKKWIGVAFASFPLLPTWLLAVFTTFVGTLMQITGIFQNCRCASTYPWQYRASTTVLLASDTRDNRLSSKSWNIAGYTALALLGLVAIVGWWFQRYIRCKFIERVENLLPKDDGAHQTPPPNYDDSVQSPNTPEESNEAQQTIDSQSTQHSHAADHSGDAQKAGPSTTVTPLTRNRIFVLPHIPVSSRGKDSDILELDYFQSTRRETIS